jgi:hypothetical protein
MKVILTEEAACDLAEAQLFYDKIEAGLGNYCVDSLLTEIEQLAVYHGFHPVRYFCHRALGSKFPFGIYYLADSHEIRVVAVLDLRRDPSWIRSELEHRIT